MSREENVPFHIMKVNQTIAVMASATGTTREQWWDRGASRQSAFHSVFDHIDRHLINRIVDVGLTAMRKTISSPLLIPQHPPHRLV
jgi:hypothetical protein